MSGRWLLDPLLIGGLVLALVYFVYFPPTGPLRRRYAPGEAFSRRSAAP